MARIVIIEDNASNLGLMGYLLNAAGHRVVGCRDGQAGLDEVVRERPDAVLCDVQLPRLSGLAVAKALRADPARRDVPLVAVSALAMRGDREKALAAGFDGYIEKPLQPENFVALVEAFLPTHLRRGLQPAAPAGVMAAVNGMPTTVATEPDRRRTILVVDEVPDNVRLIKAILQSGDYRVLGAHDMASALAMMRAEPIHLVLTEVDMAGGDGFSLRRATLEEPALASIPFVFVSSSALLDADRWMANALGVRHLVERPVDPRRLLETVAGSLRS